MKRTKFLLTALIISLLSASFINGQEKKVEKRIKVVVAEKSKPTVVFDTVFRRNIDIDSIKLKDGSIIYVGEENEGLPDEPGSVRKKVYIASAIDNNGREKRKTITIFSTDSLELRQISDGKDCEKVIVRKSGKNKDEKSRNYLYIYDDEDSTDNSVKEKDVYGDFDIHDRNTDRIKYIIAKNGIVVTLEGDDEARLNELRNDIEKRLDNNTNNPPASASNTTPPAKSGKKK